MTTHPGPGAAAMIFPLLLPLLPRFSLAWGVATTKPGAGGPWAARRAAPASQQGENRGQFGPGGSKARPAGHVPAGQIGRPRARWRDNFVAEGVGKTAF